MVSYVVHKRGGIEYIVNRFSEKEKEAKLPLYSDYFKSRKSIFQEMIYDSSDILFMGDSHIEMCNWSNILNDTNIKNLGIGGNVLDGVINQIININIPPPLEIHFMVGINDLRRNKTVKKLIHDYDSLITYTLNKYPNTKIYVYSILPMRGQLDIFDKKIISTNEQLGLLSQMHNCYYMDLYPLFLSENKFNLNKNYTFDGLHLNGKGYVVWKFFLQDKRIK